MSHFGESVDADKDSIMTVLRSRKTGDEVHLNLVPFPFRNREGLQSSTRSLVFFLDATANVTLINVTSNFLLHARPPIPLTNVLVHLGTARVNRQRGVVSFSHDIRGGVQVGTCGIDHQTAFEIQCIIIITINSERRRLSTFNIALDLLNFRVIMLSTLNLGVKVLLDDQGVHMALRNNLEVQLLEFFIQKWLLYLNFKFRAISFAAQGISHYIRYARGIRNIHVEVGYCL